MVDEDTKEGKTEDILAKKRKIGELLLQDGKEKDIAAIVVGLTRREMLAWLVSPLPKTDTGNMGLLVEELITPWIKDIILRPIKIDAAKLNIKELYRQYADIGRK